MLAAFYEGREIFVTGGSGVVGKAVIEKLLRSCNVGRIYMLLRPKKNLTLLERLEKIKQSVVFCHLLTEKPNEFDEKVVAIPGDAELPMLGITPPHLNLMENVTIVIHSAATVRFDEPLKHAIRLNVGGTLETLKFAETLKHLQVFMHVSTFFSNPYLHKVEPKLYEPPMDWKFCLDLSMRNDIPDEVIDALTRKLIVGFPNTYCFTKNLAESLANDYRHKLPLAIFRPSIVVFSMEEPEPGFSSSVMGAMGMFAAAAAGVLKSLYVGPDQRLDLTPQDIAVKCVLYYIMKSAHIYAEASRPTDIPVFQVSSFNHTILTLPGYIRIVQDHGFWIKYALEKNLLIPGIRCTDNQVAYMFFAMWKQIIPALLVDRMLVMAGRKPVLMSVQRKLIATLEVLRPFMFNNYESTGISGVQEMLKDLDGTDFNVNCIRFVHRYYPNVELSHNMVYTMRRTLFKEDPSTIFRSRMILKVKILVYKCVQIYLAYKLYRLVVVPRLDDWQWNAFDDTPNNTLLADFKS